MSRTETYNKLAEKLLSHVENNTTDQVEGTLSVPTSAYTDPQRWEREMQLIFKRLPLMLALSVELANPGDYKAIEVVGRPVLITRGKDGQARAFLNVCAHRGAPLAEVGEGNCSRFSCPYHGWTFANDGKLMGIADPAKFGEIDRSGLNLTALPCQERAGMIFVVLTPGLPIDVEAYLGGMLTDLEHFKFETWHFFGRRELHGANWKVSYDGYLEGYHFAALHTDTLFPSFHSDVMTYDEFGPHLRIGFAEKRITELHDVPREDWWRRENGGGYGFVRTLFPNVSIALGVGIGQIAQLIPGPTANQNRTILNYYTPRLPKDEEERSGWEAAMQFVGDVTDHEDYTLGRKIQKGLESGAFETVVFGRNEVGNQLFHKWVDHYLENQPAVPLAAE